VVTYAAGAKNAKVSSQTVSSLGTVSLSGCVVGPFRPLSVKPSLSQKADDGTLTVVANHFAVVIAGAMKRLDGTF